ncbi:MAG: DUF2846 domain-containing protein [Anaeromyxobacter sp.]
MNAISRLRAVVLFAAVALFTGCASVPMAPADKDLEAKSFTTPADKALVYVFRPGSLGGAVTFPVSVDGARIGQLASKTFAVAALTPGQHEVVVNAENEVRTKVNAEAGKNIYLLTEAHMGVFAARVGVTQLTDDAAAKNHVNQCKLIQPQ